MNHTKGPWEFTGIFVEHDGVVICAAESKEIGRLIAAAPELLEAAEKVIEMNLQESQDRYGDRNKAENWACVRVLRAAISKATGGAK